ncbi:hypothetical protein [Streptomyces sp. NPDC018693]|uniref:hypothetical protein n=1 Tax=unclassified Streptomyces TaxID=2593676 RepID=UPI0037B35754
MARQASSPTLPNPVRGTVSALRRIPGAGVVGRVAEGTLDTVGSVSPRGRRLAVYTGAGLLGVAGVVEWPVAVTGAAVAWLTQPRPGERDGHEKTDGTATSGTRKSDTTATSRPADRSSGAKASGTKRSATKSSGTKASSAKSSGTKRPSGAGKSSGTSKPSGGRKSPSAGKASGAAKSATRKAATSKSTSGKSATGGRSSASR